ncbi:MAG: homocysteine S-methyltransferase family protein [Flavobacteriaceae bacterium]
MTITSPALPQLNGGTFITDGGLETSIIYHHGIDLPLFASFPLLGSEDGRNALRRYYRDYLDLARAKGAGFVFESATWRASADWGARLGYDAAALDRLNADAIALLRELRREYGLDARNSVISGNIGPRGDGYLVSARMTAEEAEAYHAAQIGTFARSGAEMVTAMTLNYAEEAIGIARAARRAGLPVALALTVETDGRLPDGMTLGEAIAAIDAATDMYPAYYMINCAHPSHFIATLEAGGDWKNRIRGLRVNASAKSHAELDAATELDAGDLGELARAHHDLKRLLPPLAVVGGCCGTDHRHIDAISEAFVVEAAA